MNTKPGTSTTAGLGLTDKSGTSSTTIPVPSVTAATALLMSTKCAGTGPSPSNYVFEMNDIDLQKPTKPRSGMPSHSSGSVAPRGRRVAVNIVQNTSTGITYDAANSNVTGTVDKASTEISLAGKKIEQKLANKRVQYKKLL